MMSDAAPMRQLPTIDNSNWTGHGMSENAAERDTLYSFTVNEISSQLAAMGIVDLSIDQLRRLKSDVDRLIQLERAGNTTSSAEPVVDRGRQTRRVNTGADDSASTCLPVSDSSISCDGEDRSDPDRSTARFSVSDKNKVTENQQMTLNGDRGGSWYDRGRLCCSSASSSLTEDEASIRDDNSDTDRHVHRQHSNSHSSQLTRVTPRYDIGTGCHNYTAPSVLSIKKRDPASAVSSAYGMADRASPVQDEQLPVRSRIAIVPHRQASGDKLRVADRHRSTSLHLTDNGTGVEVIHYQHLMLPQRVQTFSSSQSAMTTDTTTTRASSNWEYTSCVSPKHLTCNTQTVSTPLVTSSHQSGTEPDSLSDESAQSTKVEEDQVKRNRVSTPSHPLQTYVVQQTAGVHKAGFGDDGGIHKSSFQYTSNPRAGIVERECPHHPAPKRSSVVTKSNKKLTVPLTRRPAGATADHTLVKGKVKPTPHFGDSRGWCAVSSVSPCKPSKSHVVHDKPTQRSAGYRPSSAVPTCSKMCTSPRPTTPSSVYNVSSRYMSRRNDPVNRYHGYHRNWLTHLAPGENARRLLRWNIKTAMMHREVPLLQRNSLEVTQLFGPAVTAYLERQRLERLKALNMYFKPPTSRTSTRKSNIRFR